MYNGDGAETLELQAAQYAKNASLYRGSAPCPQCGIIINPVEFMYNSGLCRPCSDDRRSKRVRYSAI